MALPKLNVPRYKMKLPSDGRSVNYRPFLVKEEKLLLMATELGGQEELITAIKDIITACTDIKDVEKLATFDIEYLFLNIRAKSVGENVQVNITCPDDEETQVPVSIFLDDIKVVKNRKHKKELKISDNVVVTMSYPTLNDFVAMNFQNTTPDVDDVFKMAASCIQSIADENQIYDCADIPNEEIVEFFNDMNSKQFAMIQGFFDTMPKLSHTLTVTNPETGVESEVVLEGLSAFFA